MNRTDRGQRRRGATGQDPRLLSEAERAEDERKDFQAKLEEAPPEDVFRYVFLLSNASVAVYVSQARRQADSAFRLSRWVAVAGFGLISGAIGIGVVSQLNEASLSTAYLAGAAGVLTEFISGVFFWIYNRTLQQINLFYGGMIEQQTRALTEIGMDVERAGGRIDPRRLPSRDTAGPE